MSPAIGSLENKSDVEWHILDARYWFYALKK